MLARTFIYSYKGGKEVWTEGGREGEGLRYRRSLWAGSFSPPTRWEGRDGERREGGVEGEKEEGKERWSKIFCQL